MNTPIKTKSFGEIESKVYKNLIEGVLNIQHIISTFKDYNIPIKIQLSTDDKGFFKNYIERETKEGLNEIMPITSKNNIDIPNSDLLSEEQKDFESNISYNLLSQLFRQEESIEDRIRNKLHQK